MKFDQSALRYAKALFDLAIEQNCLEAINAALSDLKTLLNTDQDFKVFVYNPLLSVEERASIAEKTFKDKLPSLLYKFILFLNYKNRLNTFEGICESFNRLYLGHQNQILAEFETAFPVDENQTDTIKQKLSQKFNKNISLVSQINGDLLGGFRLAIEGTVFDGSVKSQLEAFKRKVLM